MANEKRTLYLARCEIGGTPHVFAIDAQGVCLPSPDKSRARMITLKSKRWRFEATRSGLERHLCNPGAAAVARTPEQALAAVLAILASLEQVRRR